MRERERERERAQFLGKKISKEYKSYVPRYNSVITICHIFI